MYREIETDWERERAREREREREREIGDDRKRRLSYVRLFR